MHATLVDKATKQRCHKTAAWEKVLADEANKQQCRESAERAAVLAESVSNAEQCRSLFMAPLKMATNLAVEKALVELAQFVASWAAMLAEMALTAEQRCHEAAVQEKASTNNAELQRCQELAARAAALAQLVSAVEQSCQESANCPAVLAEKTLANERCCQKEANCGAIIGGNGAGRGATLLFVGSASCRIGVSHSASHGIGRFVVARAGVGQR